MSEYIVTCDDEVALWIGNDVESMRPLVRCRDCKHFHAGMALQTWCARLLDMYGNTLTFNAKHEDYCAWGESRDSWTTCKCGESIELGDRESAVCPSCGRTVRS